MKLEESSIESLLQILAWPEDYRPSRVEEVKEEVSRRRVHLAKARTQMREWMERRIQEEIRGAIRIEDVDRIPSSILFSKKEVETMIRRLQKTSADKRKFLRDNSRGFTDGTF